MRWSNLHIPTLRDAPADAEAASHKLLVQGGFIRQLHAGHYSLLPLGLKVHEKVADIVREEMNAIGAQEFLLPGMHPASIWKKSGRWEVMGDEMFRVVDRKGAENVLGMTLSGPDLATGFWGSPAKTRNRGYLLLGGQCEVTFST